MSEEEQRSGYPGAVDLEGEFEALPQSAEFRGPLASPEDPEHSNNHLALIYESRDEQFAAVVPFIRQGLERGERCLYVADENSRDEVLETLGMAGLDVDAALESGALEVLTVRETYLKDGSFDLDESLALLEDAMEARSDDFEGFRVTVEETWLLREDSATEDFMALEAQVNELFREENFVALCQYNRERFSPDVIQDVIRTHPHLVYDGSVNRNVYYTPPEEFFGHEQPATEIDRKLESLQKRSETKRNHQRLIQALEAAREGISLLDADGVFIYVNDAYADTFGYDPEELIGEHWDALGIEANPEYVYEEVLPTIDREGQWTGMTTCVRSDGTEFLGEHSLTQTEDDELICVIRDVTEQERLQAELEEIYGRISDAFYALDDEFRYVRINDRAEELLGRPAGELRGEVIWEAYPEISDTELLDHYREAMETQEPVTFEWYSEPLDMWEEVRVYPSETGLSVYFRNITDRKEREQELELFRELLDHSSDAVFVSDPETGRILDVNDTATRHLGYSRDELLELTIPDIDIELPTKEAWHSFVEDLKAEGQTTFDGVQKRKDGTTFPVEVNVSYVSFDREYVLSISRDITQRREYERELGEIYGRISDAFFALDEEWRFTHLNERAHEWINPEGRDLVGKNVWEEFPAATEREFKPKYERAMDEQETVSFEEYYPEPLDAWFEVRAYPSETGLSVYFRDVTERKEREAELAETAAELRESEERLRLALEAGEMGTWVLDLQTEDSPVRSPQHDRIFGYEEPVDDWDLETFLEHVHPDDRADVRQSFEDAFETGSWEFECRITRVDGEERVIAAQGEFHDDSEGEPVRAIGVVQDVTDRHEREQQLEHLVERLKESNERLEQFAYAASHDLQEPLRMVSSYLQLIENRYADAFDEEGEEFLEFAIDGADRMREMIDGLLQYSRVETQGDTLEPIDLQAVFDDALSDLQLQIEEHDAEITADDLPRVEGDASQLRQVLQNLLENAITYSGDEPPRVHVSAERDGAEWIVSVRDEGIGIDPDDQERIFGLFDRLHDRVEYPGTGIGLALCKRIVERHGGEMWVESEPGEGSTFMLTLPAASDSNT